MTKIYSPFRILVCPICGAYIESGPKEGELLVHIRSEHADVSRMSVVREMHRRLKISEPENLSSLSANELDVYLESLCQYKATTEGMRRLKARLMKKKQKR